MKLPTTLVSAFVLLLILAGCQGPTRPSSHDTEVPEGQRLTATFGLVEAVAPDPAGTLATPGEDWYKDQVFYQVWVPSFRDSDGNGLGDLAGVTEKLDYLKDLGVTALWLSPFFQSSSSSANLHGYDVTDHYRVDPRLGTMDDVKALLAQAHARGLRVILDWVPNHVSNKHPWFTASKYHAEGGAKDDWFLWRDAKPASGWSDAGEGAPGSGFRSTNGRYYYGVFGDGMPDLNWRNAGVRQAMGNVLAHWLNLGFDGARVDAVRFLYEDPATGAHADQPETAELFRSLRSEVLAPYAAAGAAKVLVAENWTTDTSKLRFYLDRQGFQATLDFPFGYRLANLLHGWSAPSTLAEEYSQFFAPAAAAGGWSFTFLSNHDNYLSRPATEFGDLASVRLAMALQMTAWGTPVLYYGNEIGMQGLAGDDRNLRRALDWDEVGAQAGDDASLLAWQTAFNHLRTQRSSLRRGTLAPKTTDQAGTSAWVAALGTERTLTVVNFSTSSIGPIRVSLPGVPHAAVPSTLVGDGGASWTSDVLEIPSLPARGVRVYALEASGLTRIRGDALASATVWAAAKGGPALSVRALFRDWDGQTQVNVVPTWAANGGHWWAGAELPPGITSGYVVWQTPDGTALSPSLSFEVPRGEILYQLPGPAYNLGTSDQWYLRGIEGNWAGGLALAEDPDHPGEWSAALSGTQVPASGVKFKVNASATAWDYFFGWADITYDETRGLTAAQAAWKSADADDNAGFTPDGTSAYRIHWAPAPGTCRLWITQEP